MRLMFAVFALTTLVIVDFARFDGYYTDEAKNAAQHYLGKFITIR